jgi:3-deoxy-7-phosphoheptulonate synthase
MVPEWSVDSWKARPSAQQTAYADAAALTRVLAKLRELPPLVTSWEIERLREQLAEAQQGKRFLLQGGDCAEQLADCRPDRITAQLKILLQMSLVMIHASKCPVVRVGRMAGQYAKPRSSPLETRQIDGKALSLPSYFGDLVNGPDFTAQSREPDPERMLDGYMHAALTLNFVRSLLEGGFADVHHPEYWDLGFMRHAGLTPELRAEYERMTRSLADGIDFMQAIGERSIEDLKRVEFFSSHEGLNLLYESAQTRTVPRRQGHYDLTTHLPWIGERTGALDGAHVEFFRGVRNPLGLKVGPKMSPEDLVRLVKRLNPALEPGRIVLILRLGVRNVADRLPKLVQAVGELGVGPVLWVCDPMHGNTTTTPGGVKTRVFSDVIEELSTSWDVLESLKSRLGGMHIELTGEDVTECLGGAADLRESDLSRNYASPCDPRLNYEQSMELAFAVAKKMAASRARR